MTVLTIYVPQVAAYVGLETYFYFYDTIGAEAVQVFALDDEDSRTLIPPSNYTTSFNGEKPIYDSGSITLTVEAPVGTVLLSIERNTPITQVVDLQSYDRFPNNVIEYMADKLTMILQEIEARKCDIGETPP